jgi:ABC-type transport system involved in multi-copper enzyme maturation permease subunit
MNPVLRKDILGLLRLRRVASIQVLFVAVLGLLVLATWPQQGIVSLASRGQDSLLLGLILGQLALLVLFVPGIAAGSITSEREQGTLEMLYASRLSTAQLILGKLFSALGYPLLLLVSGLPFMALLSVRGDVDLTSLLRAYLVLVVSAVLLAVLPLAVSAICKQTSTSLVISYVAVLVLCGGVLVPAAIMLASQGGLSARILHCTRSVSPTAAVLSLVRPQLAEFGGRADSLDPITGQLIPGLPPSWKIFLPFAWALILVCILILALVLRKSPVQSGGFSPKQPADPASRSLARRILFLIDPQKQRKPIGHLNPVLAKEARTSQLGSSRWMIRIFYGALFISMGLALMAMYGGQTEHGDLLRYVASVLVAFQVGIIALIDPSLTSPAVSSEMESGTFETLRLTPLGSGQIFWGKFLPAVLPALLPIVALLPAYGALCFVNPLYIRPVLQMLPVFVLAVVLCSTMGLACSALATSTARATVTNYLIIAAIVILPLLAWLAAGTLLDIRLASWLAMPSPLVMALNLLPGGAPEIARLLPHHLVMTLILCIIGLVMARVRLGLLLREGQP